MHLTGELKSKTKFPRLGHFAVELVAKGEAELAIAQPMEALLQPGVNIVGPLPSELQDPPNFTFTVGQMSMAKEPEVAHLLIEYLAGPTAQAQLKNRGMESVPTKE
jgi:molybdate transport system substrate-binding protein